MLPDNAFLRRLPKVTDGTQLIQLEALVFSADAVRTSFSSIKQIATGYRERICDAPRDLRTRMFMDAWTIVDSLHVVRQVLAAIDCKRPSAKAFAEQYKCATKLRNKMDHLTDNARNISNAKIKPPIYGALSYVCIRDQDLSIQDGVRIATGGGIVLLTAGTFIDNQSVELVNPGDVEFEDLVRVSTTGF